MYSVFIFVAENRTKDVNRKLLVIFDPNVRPVICKIFKGNVIRALKKTGFIKEDLVEPMQPIQVTIRHLDSIQEKITNQMTGGD